MSINKDIELTYSKDVDISKLSYEEMIHYTMHNFYLQMNFLVIKYKNK